PQAAPHSGRPWALEYNPFGVETRPVPARTHSHTLNLTALPAPAAHGRPPTVRRKYTMILVIRPDASLEQIEHVIERVRELGFTPHVSRGESRTIVGVIGDETKPEAQNFSAIPGVEQ